ncbi:MAG: c-type cytochrome [Trebonia sp.]|uniref:cytochrome bc1 complex diheme cytochrome c subunit n=1 Tax=Trebonia sp. TaxID=2767075 RepID=UPI003BB1E75F
MSSIIARRRHPAAGYAAVAVGLVAVGVLYSTLAGGGASAAAPAQASTSIAQGKSLFEQSCSSCHGLDAQGTSQAPSLIGAGAAAVYFQMSTGRMPAKELGAENDRKPTDFTEQQIYAIAAYVASLGGGPPIPSEADVSTVGANTALGEELFSTNCAQCHGFAGAGGALTYGKNAPSLNASTPTQIYTAMLTGPEAMPVFGDGTITPQEKRDIIAFITDTRNEPNPGGLSLARTGTVTEGLLIWIGGLGFLILIAMWLTARRRDRAIDEHGGDHVPGEHATTETAEQAESEHSS